MAGCSGAFCDCDDITRISSLAVQELSAWLVLQYLWQTLQYVKHLWSGHIRASANLWLSEILYVYAGTAGTPDLSSHQQWVGDTYVLISSSASFQLSPA